MFILAYPYYIKADTLGIQEPCDPSDREYLLAAVAYRHFSTTPIGDRTDDLRDRTNMIKYI